MKWGRYEEGKKRKVKGERWRTKDIYYRKGGEGGMRGSEGCWDVGYG